MPRNNGNTQKKQNYKKQTEKNVKKNFKPTNRDTDRKKRKFKPQVKTTTAKSKLFFAKKPEGVYGDPYEYKMSRYDANDVLTQCPEGTRPEQYLCDYVTEQYGLIGWCTRVIIGE